MNLPDNPRLIVVVGILVCLAIFAAYMIFLVYTWQQLQRDRSVALSKVDDIIDRLPKPVKPTVRIVPDASPDAS